MSVQRPIAFRPLPQRVTTMLWGLAVVVFGTGVIAHLSGYDFDVELLGIATLAVIGLWILVSALVASFRRR